MISRWPPIDPPATLAPFTFVHRSGTLYSVAFALNTWRRYNAVIGGGGVAPIAMNVARYVDGNGAVSAPLCLVWAAQSRRVDALLASVSRAFARHELRAPSELDPSSYGVTYPLTTYALARIALGDYVGARLAGAAGAIHIIREADYATVDFAAEQLGIPIAEEPNPN